MKKEQLFLILIFFVTLSCCKKDPAKPTNPLNGRTTAVFNPDKNYGTVYDVEGNEYKTIVIGNQTWMAENLRTTKYRNGELIPNVKDNDTWNTLTFDAYCNYNNTENLDTIATFGRLYNWYAASNSKNIAPKGWRVPNIEDWLTLINHLGGHEVAGGKLRENGFKHWEWGTNGGPYNSSGFTALPSGNLDSWSDKTTDIGSYCTFWAFNEYNKEKAGFLYMGGSDKIYSGVNFKIHGYSVRCIKE